MSSSITVIFLSSDYNIWTIPFSVSSLATDDIKKKKKSKKDKKDKSVDSSKKSKKDKKKKKKKDLLAKLNALPDADPDLLSSGDETQQVKSSSQVQRTVIEAEYIPEEDPEASDEDVPMETEKQRKKRLKKEKKDARRAAKEIKEDDDLSKEQEEGNDNGANATGETKTSTTKKSKKDKKTGKEKKLTRKQKKQLELDASMEQFDKTIQGK